MQVITLENNNQNKYAKTINIETVEAEALYELLRLTEKCFLKGQINTTNKDINKFISLKSSFNESFARLEEVFSDFKK